MAHGPWSMVHDQTCSGHGSLPCNVQKNSLFLSAFTPVPTFISPSHSHRRQHYILHRGLFLLLQQHRHSEKAVILGIEDQKRSISLSGNCFPNMALRPPAPPQAPAAPAQAAPKAESIRAYVGSFDGHRGNDTIARHPPAHVTAEYNGSYRYRATPVDTGPVTERLQSLRTVSNTVVDWRTYQDSRIQAGQQRASKALQDFGTQWHRRTGGTGGTGK
ncbi:hypothetical protein BGZ63DRAFT_381802 [Mariannaea sp. PMI_226]|nr:hypothetical protein BGZ63DRAFT_381802 [Mariannaea sp. PMI_226]